MACDQASGMVDNGWPVFLSTCSGGSPNLVVWLVHHRISFHAFSASLLLA